MLRGNSVYAQIVTGKEAGKIIEGAELIRFKNGSINYLQFRNKPSFNNEYQLPNLLSKILKIPSDFSFKIVKTEKDNLGFTHYKLKQYYKGILIIGNTYKIHTKGSKIISLNGEYQNSISSNVIPTISEDDALKNALKHINADIYKWQVAHEENWIKSHFNDISATFFPNGNLVLAPKEGQVGNPSSYQLAYIFEIYAHKPLSKNKIFISATNGDVIWKLDQIYTADSVGTAVTRYSGNQTIVADFNGTNFRLIDNSRGNGITTYDCNEGTNYNGAVHFFDNDNFWNNVNANQDEVATDAHHGSESTYDYYLNMHGRNSVDNNGLSLDNYVHYDVAYNNAFWDGLRMTYGDGDGTRFNPLTCIDVAGHEMSHALTNYTADLIYSGESGALNESFSDIFGNAVEFYAKTGNWRIGEDITVNPGKGIRNMQNPNEFSDPDTYGGNFWANQTPGGGCKSNNDYCGVHSNSGVQNFWFYLLSEGGSGTNDNNDVYNVDSIGIEKAGKIAFRNLTIYLTENSNHADARFYAIQSAIDLYGDCSQEVISTTNGWYAVGVGAAYSPPVLDINFTSSLTENCFAPVSVEFINTSRGANKFIWKFGDGESIEEFNPCHNYKNLGTYDLTLVADGTTCGNGIDSVVVSNAIDLDTLGNCGLLMNNDNVGCEQTACNGSIKDEGGNGDYSNKSTAWVTIEPENAATVTLNFNDFFYETDYDYFYVYDGNTIESPLIGAYTGNTLPNGGSITSTGGALTIKHYSDLYAVESGFDLNWSCSLAATSSALSLDGLKLTVTNYNGYNKLSWTANKKPTNGTYIVEQSLDGITFNSIYSVDVLKNSELTYLDKSNNVNTTYYRIKYINKEHNIFSNTVKVEKPSYRFIISENPSSTGFFTINSDLENIKVEVFDVLGKCILTKNTNQNFDINLKNKKSGVYILKVSNTSTIVSKKLIIH